MTFRSGPLLVGLALAILQLAATNMAPGAADDQPRANEKAAATPAPARVPKEVARGQAKILHDAIRSTLHVVHRRYYREDERLMLPAAAFKEVFGTLAQRHGAQLRWLAVDTHAMNVDHNPQDAFEKQAVQALSSGQESFESTAGGVLRHAGVIELTAECVKCHSPNRTNVDVRRAGLVIAIPVQAE